jgi:hypothetical protein
MCVLTGVSARVVVHGVCVCHDMCAHNVCCQRESCSELLFKCVGACG